MIGSNVRPIQRISLIDAITDRNGNSIQICSVSESQVSAILRRPDGSFRYFSPFHIQNALNPNEDPVTFHNRLLLAPDNCTWDFVVKEGGSLVIWPRLAARGWQDAIPKPNGDTSGLTRLARGRTQNEMTAWFYTNGYRLTHGSVENRIKIEIHMPQEGHVGTFRADDYETIKNLLRQGGYIKDVLHAQPRSEELVKGFIGRGITFTHPRDKNQTAFNVDYTKAKGEDGKWDAEERAGCHIDVRKGGGTTKVQVSTQETYHANHLARKAGQAVRYTVRSALVAATLFGGSLFGSPKSQPFKDFAQRVITNGLTMTYNASHAKHPIQGGPGGGSIGGVAGEVGVIEGLFETAAALEEDVHYFVVPSLDGKMPFSNEELGQILRELAVGVYVHETFPFFSLHFNSDANMYPVIHPVYENTLVGRVISLLDYFMKGFLNGGFLDEAFLSEWQKNRSQDDTFLKTKCIDLHTYCKKYLGNEDKYFSVREIIDNFKRKASLFQEHAQESSEALDKFLAEHGLEGAHDLLTKQLFGKDDPIFSDYSGFRSSFRIIAKQNSIKKSGALFELDGGFDVFYTIEPDPDYEEALQMYRFEHGHEPPGYQQLVYAYEVARRQISMLMPKLPIFKELFEQLKVINFFCYYLKTLKKAHKVPQLPPKEVDHSVGCLPLFPHLPLRKIKSEKVEVNFGKVFEGMPVPMRQKLEKYLNVEGSIDEEPPHDVVEAALQSFREHLQGAIKSFALSKEKEFVDEHRTFIVRFLKDQRKEFQELKSRPVTDSEQQRCDQLRQTLENTKLEEGDVELLLRAALKAPKVNLEKLKELESQLPLLISTNENKASECWWALLNSGFGGKYNKSSEEIQALRDTCKERVSKLKETLAKVQSEIKEIEEGGAMVKLFNLVQVPFTESKSVIEFFSEQPLKEREENKQVVGGCGLNLNNMPLTPLAMEQSQKCQTIAKLEANKNEEWVLVNNGCAFRLPLADFPAARDKEYRWMALLQSAESESQASEKTEFLHSILFADEERFLELLPRFKEKEASLHGIHAIHHAAFAESPFYLQKLLAAGHSIETKDLQGNVAIHYAAIAGRLENIRLLKNIDQPNKSGITPLHMAVQSNQLEAVDLLLSLGANPNTKTSYGMSPLYSAVLSGHEKIALRLSRHEATFVDSAVEDKSTPLFVAVEANMPTVVEALLQRRADCRLQRRDTFSPLHIAAKHGFLEICKSLIKAGSDVNAKLRSGKTALHLAVGYPDIVRLLLEANGNPLQAGWDGATALMSAIAIGDLLSAEYLINFSSRKESLRATLWQQDLKKETPILASLQSRQYRVVELLLSHGVSITYSPEVFVLLCRAKIDPVFIEKIIEQAKVTKEELALVAQKEGHNAFVSYMMLLKGLKIADVPKDAKGWGLEHYAAQYDHIDVIKRSTDRSGLIAVIAAENNACRVLSHLLQASQSVDGKVLAAAIVGGHEKAADLIIHKILDPNIPLDKEELRGAHIAAKRGDVKMLTLLRSRGASFAVVDKEQKTPIHYAIDGNWKDAIDYFFDQNNEIKLPENLLRYAANHGSADLIERLVKRGYKVNEGDAKTGQTAQHYAISADNLATFDMLCQHGADLSHRCSEGLTPLHLAAMLGKVHFVKKILAKGISDCDDGTVLNLAVHGGHEECVSLFLRHGIKPTKTALDIAQRLHFGNILLILEQKAEQLVNRKQLIVQALLKGKMSAPEFLNLIHDLPINKPMEFCVDGKIKNVPLLHLIHEAAADDQYRKHILEAFYQIPGVDPNIRCAQGRTLHHHFAKRRRHVTNESADLLTRDNDGKTPLHFYVGNVKNILAGKNVDIEDNRGLTPLLAAIERKDVQGVIVLLEIGADPNYINAKLLTPLYGAVETDQMQIVDLLLQHGAKIILRCLHEKVTPLHLAAVKGSLSMARRLIGYGHPVNISNLKGQTPLHVAAARGTLALMRLFISVGAHLLANDSKGNGLLHYAAKSDNPEIIDFLLAHGLSLSAASTTKASPLHHASAKGNTAMMTKLVQKGANIEEKTAFGKTALSFATESSNKEAVRFYRDSRLMQNSKTRCEAIQMALVRDSVSSLKELFRDDFPIDISLDAQGKTAIHYAAHFGARNCLIYLQQLGADLQRKDLEGHSPLDLAVRAKHLLLVRYLVHEMPSVDLNARDAQRKPYLHQACEAGAVELAALLLELGASKDLVDYQGMKPIQLAATQKNYPLFCLLLAFGAEIPDNIELNGEMRARVEEYKNVQVKGTLIHKAVALNDERHLRLLAKVEDINAKDEAGRSALHMAIMQPSLQLLAQLMSLGAKVDGTAVELAVNNFEVVEFLLDYLPKQSLEAPTKEMDNANGQAKKGNMAPFFELLSQGHPLVNEKFSLLHYAIKESNLQLFDLIYKSLRRKMVSSTTKLMDEAISKKNLNGFFKAIHDGYRVDQELFLKAIACGSIEIAKVVHKWFQADLETADRDGHTPLHLAALNGHLEVVSYLLEAGAKIDVKNSAGIPLLQSVAEKEELFLAIYAKIPKISDALREENLASVSDANCFQYLQSGYSIKEASALAAKANCAFAFRTLHKFFREKVDLEALKASAREAKAEKVLEYMNSATFSCCAIL